MKKRITIILSCLFCVCWLAMAQNTTVKGTVVSSENGEPVIGATVLVKGTATGTVTDPDGRFELTVPSSVRTVASLILTTQKTPCHMVSFSK